MLLRNLVLETLFLLFVCAIYKQSLPMELLWFLDSRQKFYYFDETYTFNNTMSTNQTV